MTVYIENLDEAVKILLVLTSLARLLDSKSMHKNQMHFYIPAINFRTCNFYCDKIHIT